MKEKFKSGESSNFNPQKRYSIYQTKNNLNIEILINDIIGNFELINYKLNREHGSSFDEWCKLGSPENMNRKEINGLKDKSVPKQSIDNLHLDGFFQTLMSIPLHGIEMIVLKKR